MTLYVHVSMVVHRKSGEPQVHVLDESDAHSKKKKRPPATASNCTFCAPAVIATERRSYIINLMEEISRGTQCRYLFLFSHAGLIWLLAFVKSSPQNIKNVYIGGGKGEGSV